MLQLLNGKQHANMRGVPERRLSALPWIQGANIGVAQ
jgi:hypothetical protein